MDRPPVQYATTASGTRIAFAVSGEGQPVVLPPLTAWTLYPPRPIPAATDLWRLAEGARLLAFNHAGTGLSQRSDYDFTLDAMVEELRTVVETADLHDFVLLAGGCAGPPAIKFAVEYPERVKHLILRETWASSADPARKRLMMFGAAIRGDWEAASQGYARLGWNVSGAEADAVAAGIRSAIEPGTLLEYFGCVAEHDVRSLLHHVSVPTTVMRRPEAPSPLEPDADRYTDELVQTIPGAELRQFEGSPVEWSTYSSFVARGSGRENGAGSSPQLDRPQGPEVRDGGGEQVHVTARERDVLREIASGDTNRQIAATLDIAEGTVKRHVSNLLQKTGLKNRRELMRFADRYFDSN